ncbi:MAG: hypothetical protein B7Y74_04905, partial [Novosphingobium sp. 35-62-5]
SVPAALIEKGVVPFIKIDKGLEDEVNGVQLMKPFPFAIFAVISVVFIGPSYSGGNPGIPAPHTYARMRRKKTLSHYASVWK